MWDSNLVLWLPVALFVTGLVVGVVLMVGYGKTRRASLPPAFLRAVLDGLGLTVLIAGTLHLWRQGLLPTWTLGIVILMVGVVAGDVILIAVQAERERVPMRWAGAHAAAALVGIAVLAVMLLERGEAANAKEGPAAGGSPSEGAAVESDGRLSQGDTAAR